MVANKVWYTAFALWFAFCAILACGLIYVAIHFILKFW